MKLTQLLLLITIFAGSFTSMAQGTDAVTDEELKKYAIAMDSIDHMRKDLVEEISEMVKDNENVTAARYNELSKIISDEAKLAQANATPEEIQAIKDILKKKDEGTARIQETFQSLAKDYVGASTYNKVRKALAEDAETKARYEALLADLKKDDSD
jgi:hypothetical protein